MSNINISIISEVKFKTILGRIDSICKMKNTSSVYLLILVCILSGGSFGTANSIRAPQLEIIPFGKSGIICRSSCGHSRSCQPQMKVIVESPANLTIVLGRLIQVIGEGVFVATCYMESNYGLDRMTKSFLSTNLSDTGSGMRVVNQRQSAGVWRVKEMEALVIQSLSSLQPEVHLQMKNVDENIVISVTCSASYNLKSLQQLELFRNYGNGTKLPIRNDALESTVTLSEDKESVTMQYKHHFISSLDYFRNTFMCEATDSFTLATKSVSTQPIGALSEGRKCDRDMSVHVRTEFSEFYNGRPLIDSLKGYLKCSCNEGAPEPKIYWRDSTGANLNVTKLDIQKADTSKQPHCCVLKQYFQNKVWTAESCWVVNKNALHFKPSETSASMFRLNSGLYWIKSGINTKFMTSVEYDTPNAGWIVIQKRFNASSQFGKLWDEYKNGFGDLNGDFWLGNEKIHQLTTSASTGMKIRFEIWDNENSTRYAQYSSFSVGNEGDNYRLKISGYVGDAGDSMTYHNNQQFTTQDKDNDEASGNCAKQRENGGWWYKRCDESNFNGILEWQSAKIKVVKTQMKIAYN